MGIKQDIVVVNEYTVPTPGGGGSRGGTPGQYITRYMARDLATETVTPIRRTRVDDFITRYMARADAVDTPGLRDKHTLKQRMAEAQGDGGVAFGYGEVSLSHDQLKAAAADVQRLFEEEGKTVMKTVISFDQEYLERTGIVEPGFKVGRKGDYRGNIDQMKLRMAVMRGMDRMGRALYDDLRWVAVIQVDTEHVHCHLSMVDAGEGTVMPDGTQKGKLPARGISLLRRGVDSWLDEKQQVAHLSSAVGHERRNVITYVKRWAHQQALREALPQFLLATLPADRRLWRLDTNRKEMAKPNRVVRELVSEVLDRPGSPMAEAMGAVHDYANHRRDTEGLSAQEWAALVDEGRARVIERGANAVYAVLRQLPARELVVRTPLLDVMGMDYEDLAARAASGKDEDDLVGFSFRLRSYASRLEHHSTEQQAMHEEVRRWEAADEAGVASPGSRALYLWWLEEEEYQAACADKYRSFLPFTRALPGWEDKWAKVLDYDERLTSLEAMRSDATLRRTKDPSQAERIGLEVYGQRGGSLVSLGDDASLARLAARAEAMAERREAMVADLRSDLSQAGLVLEVEEDGETARAVPGTQRDFEEVKGLDLHRMGFDFSHDVEVGRRSRDAFVEAARRRQDALDGAVAYLEATGQHEAVDTLPRGEVASMSRLADELEGQDRPVLRSEIARLAAERASVRRSRTVRLGAGLVDAVEQEAAREVGAALPGLLEDQAEPSGEGLAD